MREIVMNIFELKKLANKITYLLEENGGVADDYIKELMALYKKHSKKA